MDMFSTKPTPPPLPVNLPVPVHDGAASHLPGLRIPEISLASTDGGEVPLADLAAEGLVLYVFPKLGRPDQADPPGWDDVPGARGCTQQSCAFRDLHRELPTSSTRSPVCPPSPGKNRRKRRCGSSWPFRSLPIPAG